MVCTPGGIFPLEERIKNLLLVNIILTHAVRLGKVRNFLVLFIYWLLPVRQFVFSHKTMKIKRKTYLLSTCERVSACVGVYFFKHFNSIEHRL